MRHLTALLVCAGGVLTLGASQSEACLFGCFTPQTCCYGGGYSSYYGGGYTAGYAPYTSYYAPVTTYYAPTTNCCPTGTCGTSGCCPTTACYAPSCCPTNCCATCPGGTCTGTNCCPTGSSAAQSVSAPRASTPAPRVAGPQPPQQSTHFVNASSADTSHWQPQPKVRTANLQRTVPSAAPSTGWEPVR